MFLPWNSVWRVGWPRFLVDQSRGCRAQVRQSAAKGRRETQNRNILLRLPLRNFLLSTSSIVKPSISVSTLRA